jgi:hypothetical protein
MSKRIMNCNPEGKRKAGRPKARWIYVVENDMRKAGVRNWGLKLRLRDGWRRILEEAKAHV